MASYLGRISRVHGYPWYLTEFRLIHIEHSGQYSECRGERRRWTAKRGYAEKSIQPQWLVIKLRWFEVLWYLPHLFLPFSVGITCKTFKAEQWTQSHPGNSSPNLGKWFLRWSRYPKIISQNHFLFDHSKYRPLIFQNHFGRMFHFGTSHPSKSLTFNPPKSFPKDECWASKIISQADCYPFKIISLKNKIISSQHHNFNRLTPTPKSFQQVGWNSFEGPLLITT